MMEPARRFNFIRWHNAGLCCIGQSDHRFCFIQNFQVPALPKNKFEDPRLRVSILLSRQIRRSQRMTFFLC